MRQDCRYSSSSRILYAPVSGGRGSGELRRCEALMQFVSCIAPGSRQALIGPVKPRIEGVQWFPLASSPTWNPVAVVSAMIQFRPDWIVFDGNTRQAPLKFAKRNGIGTIFIASRPKGRRKALSVRRLSRLDWIWLIDPLVHRQALRWFESSILKLHRKTTLRIWSSIHERPDWEAAKHRLGNLDLKVGRYLLLCAGGGGQCVNDRPVGTLMREVAQSASAITGWPALVVGCDAENHEQVRCLPQIRQPELLALIAHSRACLVGGGSLLAQTLIEGGHCAAVGWQAEQRDRVCSLANEGLVLPANANVDNMTAALVKVACDSIERNLMRYRCQAGRFSNGIMEAASILATPTPMSRVGKTM